MENTRWQVSNERNAKTMTIYDIILEYSQTFAGEMEKKFPIKITSVTEEILEKAVKESDIITTVTLASAPIIQARWS